jgi:polyisoprenoid-binding protein YceI
MSTRTVTRALLTAAAAVSLFLFTAPLTGASAPLAIDSARITISGTSNIHAYTASTTTVRITRAELAAVPDGGDVWAHALTPGGVAGFEVAVPAATLTSPREGLDANMHKALRTAEYPDIRFRLLRFEPGTGPAGSLRGVGVLKIAGVAREVAFDITTERKGASLRVKGQLSLLMTDFGVTPPVALMGMLKTDPKVIVTIETLLTMAPIMTTQQH